MGLSELRRLLLAALIAWAVLPLGDALAQTTGAGEPNPVSTETRAVRAKLDAIKANLDQSELALEGRELPEPELQKLRQTTEPLGETVRVLIEDLTPKLEASKARLAELGPKPKAGEPEESADVARERAERDVAVAELDETQRLARTLLVQANQITAQISDRRRAVFARALFQQSSGVLSPDLWLAVAKAAPRELRALGTVSQDT